MCSQAYFLFDMPIMYFAWRMSALQCCVSFCSPAVGLSCMFAYVCVPSLLRRPPARRHPRGVAEPERSARALLQPPQLSASSVGVTSVRAALSISSRVHTPVLHTCVSLPALHAASSIPFLYIEYIGFLFFLLEARIIEFTTPYLSYNFLKKLKSPI